MINISTKEWNHRGFTFLEVVISMALISIALLAVLRLHGISMDLQSEAQFITTASYLAQDRISRIQAEGKLEPGRASGGFGEDFSSFRYLEEISKVEDTEHFYKVEISILTEDGISSKDLSTKAYIYRQKNPVTEEK